MRGCCSKRSNNGRPKFYHCYHSCSIKQHCQTMVPTWDLNILESMCMLSAVFFTLLLIQACFLALQEHHDIIFEYLLSMGRDISTEHRFFFPLWVKLNDFHEILPAMLFLINIIYSIQMTAPGLATQHASKQCLSPSIFQGLTISQN